MPVKCQCSFSNQQDTVTCETTHILKERISQPFGYTIKQMCWLKGQRIGVRFHFLDFVHVAIICIQFVMYHFIVAISHVLCNTLIMFGSLVLILAYLYQFLNYFFLFIVCIQLIMYDIISLFVFWVASARYKLFLFLSTKGSI